MENLRLFLCGDVMIGRGIDQILSHPNNPQLYETYVLDARDYVFLAEELNGKIDYPVSMDYIWGDALDIFNQLKPIIKIINLETAITKSDDYLPNKGIHYRSHPFHVETLKSAGIDICTLANNHILDWGEKGLLETISTLNHANIKFSGVGGNNKQATKPAIFNVGSDKRIVVFAAGMSSSGIPSTWQATAEHPGLYYLPDFSDETLATVAENIKQYRQPNDVIVFSIHWGSNWGYEVAEPFRTFAHGLIDIANVDVIFGHSSHHPRPIEIYHDKPILYGCGDFINDYEGIRGYEGYRGDLTLMYFIDFDNRSLQFKKMTLVPLQMKQFSLHRARKEDCIWMLNTLNQSANFTVQWTLPDQYLTYIHIIRADKEQK